MAGRISRRTLKRSRGEICLCAEHRLATLLACWGEHFRIVGTKSPWNTGGDTGREGPPGRTTVLRKRLLSTDLSAYGGNRRRTDNGIKYRRKLSFVRSLREGYTCARYHVMKKLRRVRAHLRSGTPLLRSLARTTRSEPHYQSTQRIN